VYREDIERWLNEKTSYLLIHEYLNQRGVMLSETTVRRQVQRMFPGRFRGAVMLRETIPGEILEVDFGYLGLVYDSTTDRRRKGWVFSARLRHSRAAWREICTDENQQSFFNALIHAFEYFGGVPDKVVPDNMKSAVIKASYQEPIPNKIFQQMAIHYDFLISPTLPRRPEHKGGVENDVKYIKGNFWPRYRESERQLGHESPHLENMQTALEEWNENIADVRKVGGVGRRPTDMFRDEEESALRPLPAHRWNIVSWASAKVQESWRIQYDRSFYSVPFQYIGKRVTVLADLLNVVIYLGDKEIARHRRAMVHWSIRRESHHAPKELEAFLKETKEGLMGRARNLGPSVMAMCRTLFSRNGVDGLRPVRSLLALVKTYGPERLEAACRRALEFDESPRYGTVKRILKRDLDSLVVEAVPKVTKQDYAFQRELGFFDTEPEPQEVVYG